MGTLLISRFIGRIVINAIGGATRSRRREKLYQNLESHDLSDRELAQLWPYVAIAVNWGGLMLLFSAGLFLLVGTPVIGLIGLALIGYGGEAGSTALTLLGIGATLLALSCPYLAYKMYGRRNRIKSLKADLKRNPRSVPGTPEYDTLVDVMDLKSEKAYPDECPVDRQDALEFEPSESSAVGDTDGTGQQEQQQSFSGG